MEKNQTLAPFTPYQKFIIAIIALIQFTVVLDFMVISPLGPIMTPALDITPRQFGLVVAAYAFSAFLSGILSAGIADKYDRKKFLMIFYTGFVIGTLFCAIAPTYELLLLARVVTGLFGGVIGGIGMAIITDLFEINQRGRVLGFTQMGFSASQVLGIPLSLALAENWGWNSPFYLIVVLATIMGLVMVMKMQPVTRHLELQNGTATTALPHLLNTLKPKRYRIGYLATAVLPLGGFMMMPFSSDFSVRNLGVGEEQLWFIFLINGMASMAIFPLMGWLSDKYNKLVIFGIASAWAIVMVIVYTHLSFIPIWLVILTGILMFIGIMGRIVPSTILISALPEMKDRGAFMAINSSLQYLAGGVAAIIAGLIITRPTPTSPLEHFDTVGYVIAVISVLSVFLMYRVHNIVKPLLQKPGPAKKEEPVLVTE